MVMDSERYFVNQSSSNDNNTNNVANVESGSSAALAIGLGGIPLQPKFAVFNDIKPLGGGQMTRQQGKCLPEQMLSEKLILQMMDLQNGDLHTPTLLRTPLKSASSHQSFFPEQLPSGKYP